MHDYQNQILIGTVLAGGFLDKAPRGVNCFLRMSGEPDWLLHKMAEMPDYFPAPAVKNNRAHSVTHEKITTVRRLLYDAEGNRRLDAEVLDGLTDTGLAVWWLDGGGRTGRDNLNAYLNTTRFGEKGSLAAEKYFNDMDMHCRTGHEKDRFRLLFTVDGTLNFLKAIAHRFPTFMAKRI